VPFAFKFKHQIVAAQLDAPADFLKRFARESRRVPPDSLLRWQTGAGISGPVVLKSGSGHTNFVADGDVIRGQTRYATDDYQEPTAWETRGAYSRHRLQALFQIIEQAGGMPMMLAVTHVAACPIAKVDGASVRQQIAHGLGILDVLNSRTAPWDFTLRSGRPVGNDCFLSVQVAWYQTRSFTVVPRPGQPTTIREWEGHVDEEGIELRFDFNNKLALFSGRVDSTGSQIIEAVDSAQNALPGEFEHVCAVLERAIIPVRS